MPHSSPQLCPGGAAFTAMKHISSRDNGDFKAIKRLAQSGRERRSQGRTLLDGVHLIQAYEASIGPVETLIVNETAVQQAEIAVLIAGRTGLILSESLFREAAVVDTPSGVMALALIPAPKIADPCVDTVLLDGVQDPGNVGTLLRTAAAAGFCQVLLSPDCAGVWSPRVLRAGQGAHFSLSLVEGIPLAEFIHAFQGTTAVTTLTNGSSLFKCDLCGTIAWIFGSEGHGVRPEIVALSNQQVTIPMPGVAESLNVGAAAAICLFETVRQRSFLP